MLQRVLRVDGSSEKSAERGLQWHFDDRLYVHVQSVMHVYPRHLRPVSNTDITLRL
jgi:hypothetical protein